MPKDQIEWIPIKKFKPEPIGAIGFLDGKAAIVVSFFDDRDGNKDGEVSWGEWAASKLWDVEGSATTEVAMQARVNMDVLERDVSFGQVAMKMFLNFAGGQIRQGVYTVYFSRGVKMAGGALAKSITSGMVKELVVRKGFEAAAKKAFEAAVE